MNLRIYYFPTRDDTEGFLVEAANVAQAGHVLLEHLFAEPHVATPAELIRLTKAGVEVVRTGDAKAR